MANCKMLLLSIAFLFLLCLPRAIAASLNRQLPLQPSASEVNNAIASLPEPPGPQPFGVGIDLSSSYGTISIAYANGTTLDVAQIRGEPAYNDLLAKWSLESSQHVAPPYNDLGEAFNDGPRQARRRQRKAKGLPASEDVETLSTMLRALRGAAESYLGHSIDSAMAATPNLVALYREDIWDAFEYVGLRNLDNPNYLFRMFHESAAAIAGNGIGLCHDYTDPTSCDKEIGSMPMRDVLSVLYTKTSLCVEVCVIKSVYANYPHVNSPPTMDFTLGLDELHNNPNEEYYWQGVRDTILRAVMAGLRLSGRPAMVFVFGESSEDQTFRNVLDDALVSLLGVLPEMYDRDPVFRTAQGAAEIAKRGGYMR